MSPLLKGKNILVTGGSGSIGKEIVRKSLFDGASLVRVFSNDENGLYETELEFSGKNVEYVIGDIRNSDTVNSIVKDIDIVFHTSALKHVDRCELNPYEAVTVNTIGAYNICKASMKESVSKEFDSIPNTRTPVKNLRKPVLAHSSGSCGSFCVRLTLSGGNKI